MVNEIEVYFLNYNIYHHCESVTKTLYYYIAAFFFFFMNRAETSSGRLVALVEWCALEI